MINNNLINYTYNNAQFQNKNGAIIPVGSFEQHGLHAPLGTDSFISKWFSKKISRKFNLWLLPVLCYGVSSYHKNFFGTIWFSSNTYEKIIEEIVACLLFNNIQNIIILNSHGGNIPSLTRVVNRFKKYNIEILLLNWWKFEEKQLSSFIKSEKSHAGAKETSLLLMIKRKLIDHENIIDGPIIDLNDLSLTDDISKISNTGVLGKASSYSKKKIRKEIKIIWPLILKKVKSYLESNKRNNIKKDPVILTSKYSDIIEGKILESIISLFNESFSICIEKDSKKMGIVVSILIYSSLITKFQNIFNSKFSEVNCHDGWEYLPLEPNIFGTHLKACPSLWCKHYKIDTISEIIKYKDYFYKNVYPGIRINIQGCNYSCLFFLDRDFDIIATKCGYEIYKINVKRKFIGLVKSLLDSIELINNNI